MRKDFYEFLLSSGMKPRKVLHVGANTGQEAQMYEDYGIEGWHVEAIPELHQRLEKKCSMLESQHAISALIGNIEGVEVEFNIASNNGQSSSMLELGRHSVEYPQVTYEKKILLKTKTVDGLLDEEIIPGDIDFLLLDTQGAEGLVLEGASKLLESGFLIACQIETAVVPLYENGSTYLEIAQKLRAFNLHLKSIDFNDKGWTDALFMKPYWSQCLESRSYESIEVLRPKPSPFPLIRIGGNQDGAYLVPDDLLGIKACFSPGVSNRKDFEDELLHRFEIQSHMCDYSSDAQKFRTPLEPGQTFHKKWLDVNDGPDAISLEKWVSELAPKADDDLMLQIDIEGAEYRNLLNTPASVLRRFRIIVIEMHGLGVCKRPREFSKELGPLLSLLDKYFVCVHAHPNNCCGDFVLEGSDLNIPNVHELTFLRRDRWDEVQDGALHDPMLPHPLDIPANVSTKPPLFLNEHWLESGERAPESTIKMLKDQVDYFSRALQEAQSTSASTGAEMIMEMRRLAQYAASLLPDADAEPEAKELIDLAQGKEFMLSSKHSACPKENVVVKRHPFFFHTEQGRNQFITIDLGSSNRVFELIIANRSDRCMERARCLFYCVHDEQKPDLTKGLPVDQNKGFLSDASEISRTNLRGAKARYVTVFSPESTMLHFSQIGVMGVQDD